MSFRAMVRVDRLATPPRPRNPPATMAHHCRGSRCGVLARSRVPGGAWSSLGVARTRPGPAPVLVTPPGLRLDVRGACFGHRARSLAHGAPRAHARASEALAQIFPGAQGPPERPEGLLDAGLVIRCPLARPLYSPGLNSPPALGRAEAASDTPLSAGNYRDQCRGRCRRPRRRLAGALFARSR